MIPESYTLAMLPIAHLTHRIDPFDRNCRGNCALGESYRTVVNAGVRAYQLHTYLCQVQQCFGTRTRRLVYKHQLEALDRAGVTGGAIEKALELLWAALETSAVTLPTPRGEVEVPLEMNIALLLLLDYPQSPVFVPDPARRSQQIECMEADVDWCFAQCLIRERAEIRDAFAPVFEALQRAVAQARQAGSGVVLPGDN